VTRSAVPPFDADALADALRTLGLLYGSAQALADAVREAPDLPEAIRRYLRTARPHLLGPHEAETLERLVREAHERRFVAPPAIESHSV